MTPAGTTQEISRRETTHDDFGHICHRHARIDQGLRRQGGAQSARSQGTEAFDLWLPRPKRRRQEHYIKLLLGLTHPTGGTATVFGQDITRDSTAIRQRAGCLAQDPRYYEDVTARQT